MNSKKEKSYMVKSQTIKRDRRVYIRVSCEELEVLKKDSKVSKLGISAYVRKKLIYE